MRCSSYRKARDYNLKKILQHHSKDYKTFQHSDALALYNEKDQKYIFCFNYGCVVFWNFDQSQEKPFIESIKSYGSQSKRFVIEEEYEAELGNTQSVKNDLIALNKNENILLQMLTVSYALSQSAILSVFETRIWSTIERTKYLPEELAKKGRTSMSRHELTKQVGLLLKERHSVNLHTDILDTPEFLWDNPEFENLYALTRSDLSIGNRTEVLNTRLEIVHELLSVIREEITSRHSSFLEWIIIILIAFEVVLSLLVHVFDVF